MQQSSAEHLPPFWIHALDSHGRPIDPRVVEASERLWPWAYRRVERELHDSAAAAQLLEGVAAEVSRRLHEEPGVGRNLSGYLITSFHRRVRQQFLKQNRVAYEGLLRDLEQDHHLAAPDWQQAIERELCLQVLIQQLTPQSQHMLHYRILGFSWKEIGRTLGQSGKQARSRFYYELDKAQALLRGTKADGAGPSEESV
jgi:DNA-directed RNA polymerase specialized sigma24 family protein